MLSGCSFEDCDVLRCFVRDDDDGLTVLRSSCRCSLVEGASGWLPFSLSLSIADGEGAGKYIIKLETMVETQVDARTKRAKHSRTDGIADGNELVFNSWTVGVFPQINDG